MYINWYIAKINKKGEKKIMTLSTFLIPAGIAVLIIGAIIAFFCSIYRVAEIDKALVITGGKEPIIKVSGGSFVIPIFRKASYFDLCMLTVPADSDEIKTKTSVPIVVDWTAQIRPNTKDTEILRKAIISFKERGNDGIIDDVKLTLMGAVRGVVATLTPEQVQNDKETFKNEIMKSVSDELDEMGLELVSLNIQDITDNGGYYDDIAAIDREDKRKEAEKVRAFANQQIRQQAAESEKVARHTELESELEIAEKAKNNDLKKAAFQIETDIAKANAAVAGELQRTVRMQEVAEQEGKVEIVRQEQANFAATKEKEVIATRAESEKQRRQIEAEADANVQKIDADAKVLVAEKKAHAVKIEADAYAEKTRKEGHAVADVAKEKGIAEAEITKQKGLAEAQIVKERGLAEAEIIKERGLAEAETERAKLMAQADGERALADARASNEKVNFEIEKLKIEQEAKITIATKTAEIMANLGQNAEFVNIGAGAQGPGALGGGTGNVLLDTLAGIPALMKTLDVQNQALNGRSMNEEVHNLVSSVVTPMKGLLVNKEADGNNSSPADGDVATEILED
jgi:flotillin